MADEYLMACGVPCVDLILSLGLLFLLFAADGFHLVDEIKNINIKI